MNIAGLPAHPLLVHAAVTVIPLAGVVVALAALLPRFRAWAGWLPLGLSILAIVMYPLAASSGESLEESVGRSELIHEHEEAAHLLIPTVIALVVLSAAITWWRRRESAGGTIPGALRVGVMVVAVLVGIFAVVQTGIVGHLGAESVWQNTLG